MTNNPRPRSIVMPVRQRTDEEQDQVFGNGLIILGGRGKTPPKKNPHEGPSALDEKKNRV
jgi:hypothetical protein